MCKKKRIVFENYFVTTILDMCHALLFQLEAILKKVSLLPNVLCKMSVEPTFENLRMRQESCIT